MKDVSYRINNLELRMTTGVYNNKYLEIMRWFNEGAGYTIAYWIKDVEGWNLKFYGSRPMEPKVNHNDFWELVCQGQKTLDRWH